MHGIIVSYYFLSVSKYYCYRRKNKAKYSDLHSWHSVILGSDYENEAKRPILTYVYV